MANYVIEQDPFALLEHDLWFDETTQQEKIDAFVESAGPQQEFWADPIETKAHDPILPEAGRPGLRQKLIACAAGLAIAAAGLGLSRSERHSADSAKKNRGDEVALAGSAVGVPLSVDEDLPDLIQKGLAAKAAAEAATAAQAAADAKAAAEAEAARQAAEAAQQEQAYNARQPVRQNQSVTSDSNMGDFLNCVRNRESGGNYGIYNSGGSGAAGAYQFMPGTWNSIAASSGRGDLVGLDPAQASPADQDAMAQALYAQQGAGPWGGGC